MIWRPVRRQIGCGLLVLLASGMVQAHIPLTPSIVDDALDEIENARSAAESNTASRPTALYELAIRATGLMDLLNQEVGLHGFEQRELLDAAVAAAADLGIEITWSEAHQRYFYRGAAYSRYLELVPDGLEAANSRFHLIETGFYLSDTANRAQLDARLAMSRDYLRLYPDTSNAERVAMFLAIDYRDLWRICRAADEQACETRYAKLLREHLNAVSTRYGEGKTGEMARTLLARFEAELANGS